MRELDASELIYVNGVSDSITSGLTETETTLTTRGGIKDYDGWQSGAIGAALGNALYVLGKSLGWWS
jgi:hypothetical protein